MAIGKSKEARPRQGVRNECKMFRLLCGLSNDQALSAGILLKRFHAQPGVRLLPGGFKFALHEGR